MHHSHRVEKEANCSSQEVREEDDEEVDEEVREEVREEVDEEVEAPKVSALLYLLVLFLDTATINDSVVSALVYLLYTATDTTRTLLMR